MVRVNTPYAGSAVVQLGVPDIIILFGIIHQITSGIFSFYAGGHNNSLAAVALYTDKVIISVYAVHGFFLIVPAHRRADPAPFFRFDNGSGILHIVCRSGEEGVS